MAVYRRGYQRYQGPLTGHGTRLLAAPRFAWERLFQQRLVLVCTIVAFIWPLLCGVFIYLANNADLWAGFGPAAKVRVIDASFFLVFMNTQATFALLLAALAGPGLIAPDLANNALPLYFSRPLSRLDYVLARLLVLFGMLSLVTWVPGLALFGMQSGMAGRSWFSSNWQLGTGILAGFLVWILVISLVALASSAHVKWRVVAGALVLGFFFVLAGAAEMVNRVFRVEWGSLLNPSRTMYTVWCEMLGVDPPQGLETSDSIIMLVVLAVLLALVLERKLRPVEVVT
jgi:ABC-2 type transport system permease protein